MVNCAALLIRAMLFAPNTSPRIMTDGNVACCTLIDEKICQVALAPQLEKMSHQVLFQAGLRMWQCFTLGPACQKADALYSHALEPQGCRPGEFKKVH